MFRFKNYLIVAAGVCIVAFALGITPLESVVATHVEGAAHVFVNNPSTSPVPVRDVDNGRQPFTTRAFTFVSPLESSTTMMTVPAGKRFVIETIGVQADVPTGQKMRVTLLATVKTTGGNSVYPPLCAPDTAG